MSSSFTFPISHNSHGNCYKADQTTALTVLDMSAQLKSARRSENLTTGEAHEWTIALTKLDNAKFTFCLQCLLYAPHTTYPVCQQLMQL